MTENKIRKICAGLVLCMSLASLTGCGSSKEGDAESAVMGRLTAASDTKIVMEVFGEDGDKKPDGERPDAVSGSGARFDGKEGKDGKMPEGTPPADKQQGEKPPTDGQKPDGTPPSDDDNQRGQGGRKGESKTYQLDDDTKIYKQSGDEKTEISINEVDLGSMISVETEGDTATSITVQDSSQFGNRGNRGNRDQAKKETA